MKYLLTEDWGTISELVVYGAGRVMKNNLEALQKFFKILTIVDGNCEKWGKSFRGILIQSPAEAAVEMKGKKILIMTAGATAQKIGEELKLYGLVEGQDYCSFERFVCEWFWRYKGKAVIMELHTAITTRCTLQCKNCNMFIPYYKTPDDYSLEQLKKEIGLLFTHIDYIFTYHLLGGEPLLHPELAAIIEYIGEHYQDRIGSFGIVTNGTIIPCPDVLQMAQKYRVIFHISDYSKTVHYQDWLDNVIAVLEEYNIEMELNRSLNWLDFGYPENPCHFEENKIRAHMLACGPIFHGFNDGKLFYCHIAWSADKAGLFPLTPGDYIDLNESLTDMRSSILDHCSGHIPKRYVALCSACRGCGADNQNSVCAAIQKSDQRP